MSDDPPPASQAWPNGIAALRAPGADSRFRERLLRAARSVVLWLHDVPLPPHAPFRACVAGVALPEPALGPRSGLRQRIVSGCGADLQEAAFRTAAEAVERYCASFRGQPADRRASPEAMGGDGTAPADLLLISERQYDQRLLWNLRHPGRHQIPPRVDVAAAVDWLLPAPRLSTAALYAPASMVLLGHPERDRHGWPGATSAGAALGRSPADAARRALCELVERDATARWWYGHERPAAAAFSPSPWLRAVVAWLAQAGRRATFLQLATDFAVPVVACLTDDGRGKRPIIGTAAGATLAAAADAALREQLLFAINLAEIERRIAGGGGSSVDPDAASLHAWHHAYRLHDLRPLLPGSAARRRMASAARSPTGFRQIRDRIANAGLPVLGFDLTHPEFELPVVKFVVPGLRPTLARFAAPAIRGRSRASAAPARRWPLNREPYPF